MTHATALSASPPGSSRTSSAVVTAGPLLSLAYVSAPRRPFPPAELAGLLAISRRNNVLVGVTGMLLYKGGNFMQALEGPEWEVRALQVRIARDPRHRNMITVLDTWTDERQFGDWSMGFRDFSDRPAGALPGYNEFLNAPFTGEEFAGQPSRAQRLLLAFKLSLCRARIEWARLRGRLSASLPLLLRRAGAGQRTSAAGAGS